MNKSRFFDIIRNPESLRYETDLPLVKELIESFPYYATPYVMLAKMMHDENSIYFDKNLKLGAAYIGNREVLYHYIKDKPANAQFDEQKMELRPEMELQMAPEPGLSGKEVSEIQIAPQPVPEPNIAKVRHTITTEISIPEKIAIKESIEDTKETLVAVPESKNEEIILGNPDTDEEPETIKIKPFIGLYKPIETTAIETNPESLSEKERLDLKAEPIEEIWEVEIKQKVFDSKPETNDHKQILEPIAIESKAEIGIEPKPTEPELITEKPIEKTEKQISREQLLAIASQDYFMVSDNLPKVTPEEKIEKKASEPSAFQFAAYDYFGQFYKNAKAEATEKKEIGNAKNEPHVFSDWFELLEKSKNKPENIPVIPEDAPKTTLGPTKDNDVMSLIDKFIQNEPRIKQQQTRMYNPEDMAKKSVQPDFSFATETMANIFLKQGLNIKAIEIFQQLILKYPQKSDYFAEKIREIQSEGHL